MSFQSTICFELFQPYLNNYGPGTGPDAFTPKRSYLDIKVDSDSFTNEVWDGAAGWYDAWCLNPTISLMTTSGDCVPGTIYSSYGTLPVSLSTGDRSKLDEVNWVLNQTFGANVNYGEVQVAIWRLLGFADSTWNSGATLQTLQMDGVINLADVDAIVAQANAHNGFVPSQWGQTLGAVVERADGQPIIVEVKLARLGDYVWLDSDGDGLQDGNELGVDGVVVTLSGIDGFGEFISRTTVTGDNPATAAVERGFYLFDGLVPGNYNVTFAMPNGFAFTTQLNPGNPDGIGNDSDANATSGETSNITLSAGESELDVDAGLVYVAKPASLGDRVWLDQDKDGIQDPTEPGVPGVTVELYACAGGAPFGSAIQTTVTDAGGNYVFGNLVPGDYIVRFIKGGFALTTQDVSVGGGTDANDSDANASSGFTGCYTLGVDQYNPTVDAGVLPAAIGDRVWEDKDADGVQDPGEDGIPGAVVELYTCVNGVPGVKVGQTTTDGLGNYGFSGLMPGDYIVKFLTPGGGYTQTTANVATPGDAGDSDAGSGGLTGCYTLGSGLTDNTVDAGFYRPASLGDRVWLDQDQDGIQDANEPGVSGVSVELYACVGGVASGAALKTTTTDGSGNYAFTQLRPGDYIVKFIAPSGSTLTTANVGLNDGADSDAGSGGFTGCYNLESGENDISVDAGLVQVSTTPGIQIVKDVVGASFVAANTPVSFTYSVSNTGNVELGNIVVKDDNATPAFAADDFSPSPVLSAGFNIGDLDKDNRLDLTEVWKYSATVIPPVDMTVTVTTGAAPLASGTLSYQTLPNGDIRVYYLQDKNFNDNTYGTGSDSGWTSQGKTHTFSNLTGSDKAGFEVKASDGTVLFKFYQDYITASTTNIDGYTAYSGYQSLGFSGGDGSYVSGLFTATQAPTYLKDFDSTLETNMNQAGTANNGVAYTAMIVNSPVGDAKWDVVNGYAFTISAAAFSASGKSFGGVAIFDQHNSPAKVGGSNTYIPVVEGGASVNTAVVTGTPPTGPNVTDSDPATVIIVSGPLGSLGDRVWFDADADGVQDAGEAGIVGATVNLSADFNGDNTPDYTATATTGSNGSYSFTGLPAGTYTVSVDPSTLGGTVSQTYDLDGLSTAHTAVATLATGQNRTDVDFGYVRSDPGFTLDKLADKASVAAGGKVTYTYTVANTTGRTISNVTLKDDNATAADAGDDFAPTRLPDQVGDNDNLLEAGEVWKYTATVTPPVEMTVTIGSVVYDSGTLTYKTLANGDIQVFYRQSFNFNDNTYGTGSEGWTSRTHTFGDLTGSDKAGFEVKDGNGTVLFKFYQDYITASTTNIDGYTAYSGYQSLGFSGGDGGYVGGQFTSTQAASYLYDFDSTLETNLNRTGYTGMTVNSPTNDPNWDKVDGYSFVVKASAFGTAGFGGVSIFDQHNSPAKTGGSNTYVPEVVGGPSTNTAILSGTLNGQQVVSVDSATVIVTTGGGGGGGGGGPTKFFVVDSGADDVFRYSANGGANAPSMLASANTESRGVTGDAAGTMLWVLDKNKTVYVYGTDGSSKGSWVAGALGKEPEGIAKDGADIWIVDRGNKSVYWYDNAAASLSGTDNPEKAFLLAAANDKPKGITTDGTYLWVVEDDTANTVFRYSITRDGSGNATGITPAGSWTLDARNTTPTGITIDPTGASQSLWVVDSGTDTVYEYANARSLASGSNVAAVSTFALGSGNALPQDIFDPMAFGATASGDSLDWIFDGQGAADPYAEVAGGDWMVEAGLLDGVKLVGASWNPAHAFEFHG